MDLDSKDLAILDELIKDSSRTTQQLSKVLRIPITTVHNRIKKMRSSGVISQYTVRPNFALLGKSLHAQIFVTISYRDDKVFQEDIARKIISLGAHSVHILTGETDLLVDIHLESVDALNDFVTHKLRFIDGVAQTRTALVLKSIRP